MLLNLPLELVYLILAEAVQVLCVRKALELRLVCKLFDKEIECAVLEHPMFEIPNGLYKSLPYRASLKFTTQLIVKRLRDKDAKRRPLCNTINAALKVLESMVDDFPSKKQRYAESLALAAARNLCWTDIVECLSLDPEAMAEQYKSCSMSVVRPLVVSYNTPGYDSNLNNDLSNALIAAISTHDKAAVTALKRAGADVLKETDAFGHPIEAAATHGLEDIICDIMGENDTKSNLRRLALNAAAKAGRQHVVNLILENPTLSPGACNRLKVPIRRALGNGHESLALLLLRYRRTAPLGLGMRGEYPYQNQIRHEALVWFNILHKSIRREHTTFLRSALDHFPDIPDLWLGLLSHAIRKNSVAVFEMALTNASPQVVSSITLEENRATLENALKDIPSDMIDILSKDGKFSEVLSIIEVRSITTAATS